MSTSPKFRFRTLTNELKLVKDRAHLFVPRYKSGGRGKGAVRDCERNLKAAAAWQWWNCAVASMPAGRVPLRVNLDETAICLYQGGSKGVVFCRKRKGGSGAEPFQKVSLAKRRTYLTHIGLICDAPALQPLLPQVLIGNEETFAAGAVAGLQAACPQNVHLLRQKSAWNNVEACKTTVRLLAKALEPHLGPMGLQPVLFLDAAPLHLQASLFQCCVANGIWPIVVPARLTWLLQPLDTHVFLKYKRRLRARYQSRRLETADGQLSVAQFLPAVCDAIKEVLEGQEWAKAFDQNGFGERQRAVSAFVLRQCQLEGPPGVPSSLPTPEILQRCWPRKRKVHLGWLLRPYRRLDASHAPAGGARPAPLALPAPPPSGQAALCGGAPPVARGRLLASGRVPFAPPVAPPSGRPVTRLQAALARSSSASSSSTRPGKAERK